MRPSDPDDDSLRVLVVPVTRRDGEATSALLARAGVACQLCADPREMAAELLRPVGALMLTDVALLHAELPLLVEALREQPAWSDIPVVVLVREQSVVTLARGVLEQLGNVTILDRPVSTRSMTSAVQSALRDRRKQYRIRDQLHRQALAEQRLQEADRRKDEFLATLAHELRNPLAPIRTGLQVLSRLPGETEPAQKMRAVMERQMELMVKLIDELLDVSRIATGKVVLKKQSVDLRDVVASALEGSQPAMDAARHRLDVQLPAAPVWVTADPPRLSQVISNLLNNAAKYTPDGGRIVLELRTAGDDAVVSVTDSGVGLPPDQLEHVFQMFSQVNRTLERSQGGLGIGLSLVRRLMELHDGTVTAQSEGLDLGSTFTLRMPLAASTAALDPAIPSSETAPHAASIRVLIIDDNADAADALAALATADGHVALTRYTPEEGLAAAEQFAPDVVLCDIGMPRIDGYEVASRLRRQPAVAHALLVAITGWGGEADRRRAMRAGFDRHLTKPISYLDFAGLFLPEQG